MTSYHFRLATPQDDAAISALLAQSTLPGWVSLSYRTAPGAHGLPHPQATNHTLIAQRNDGAIAGMVTRSIFPGHLNGQTQPLSYLGHFRVAAFARRRTHLLRRAFDAFRETLDTPPGWSFASLLDGNLPALRLLTAGLPGFPRFTPLSRYQTLALRAKAVPPDPTICTATAADLPELAAFIATHSARRPLSPHLTADDLAHRWPALTPADFLIAGPPGHITGAVALWDQRPFRHTHVTGYTRPTALLRPLINAAGPLTGFPRLPPAGSPLSVASLSFLTTAPADTAPADTATALRLIAAARSLAAARNIETVVLGLAEDDPLLPALRENNRCASYGSCIYAVTWQDHANVPPPDHFARMKPDISLL